MPENVCDRNYSQHFAKNFLILTSFRTLRKIRFTAWNIVLTNDIFYSKLLSFFLLSRSEYLGTWKRTHFVVIGKLLEEMLQGRMEFSKYKKSLTASKIREYALSRCAQKLLYRATALGFSWCLNGQEKQEEKRRGKPFQLYSKDCWNKNVRFVCMNLTIFVWNKSNSFSL